MRCAKFAIWTIFFTSFGLAAPAADQSAGDSPMAQASNYGKLGKLIRGQRGKVVLVSFWSVY